ncbi:hypothetical protein [Kitasatospora sp. NPDC101183]|uniref:hypothetical protein n=1 Tax=Kitasatospora sp. NPDC101183 TaxID=3364100 RepID=UPI00380C4E14
MSDREATVSTRPRRTRRLGYGAAVLAAALPLALLSLGAAPSEAEAHARRSLAGTWNVTVTVQAPSGPSVAVDVFVFRPDHELVMDGPAGPDGKPYFTGTGFWESEQDGSIAFYITHPTSDLGPIPGSIQAIHQGRITGTSLRTHAEAFVANPGSSALTGPVTVTAVGTKVSDATR